MENLLKFNEMFPESHYREVRAQVVGGTPKEYQDSKAPINQNILNFDDVKNTKNRIGWIVPKEYIVVDLDSKKDAGIVYEILKAKSIKFAFMLGKHGGHFVFKNSKAVGQIVKGNTPIGLKIDTRCLEKGYIILPHNDTDRKWGEITNEVDELPFFLTPIKKLKIDVDFVTLGEGGGRNQELFKHFLNLKDFADEITLEQKVDSIKIINDYVLKDKLDNKELLQTVLRDDIVHQEVSKPKKMSLEDIASKIIEDKKMISCNEVCYLFNGKYYKELDDKEIERIIHEEYSKKLEERQRKEIIKFIKLKTWTKAEDVNKNWNEIVCRNGILNITNMKLYPHTALRYNTIYVDYDYNDTPKYSKIIDTFLNDISCYDENKKALLLEMIGYCFIQRNILQKFFICYGDGGTGKSTYLTLIKNLIGEQNCSFLGLTELDKEFMGAELFGKLANIGDEIDFRGIIETDKLKKLVSGEKTMTRQIYKAPFSFNNFAKLIFSTNKLPTFNDKSLGLYRRLIIIEINKRIEKPDPFFLDKLTEDDYEYLMFKAIGAVRSAISKNAFSKCENSEKNLEKFRTDQSSVLTFLEESGNTREQINGVPCKQLYEEYKDYCLDCGYKPVNKRNFQDETCSELKLMRKCTTRNGDQQQWRFVI